MIVRRVFIVLAPSDAPERVGRKPATSRPGFFPDGTSGGARLWQGAADTKIPPQLWVAEAGEPPQRFSCICNAPASCRSNRRDGGNVGAAPDPVNQEKLAVIRRKTEASPTRSRLH